MRSAFAIGELLLLTTGQGAGRVAEAGPQLGEPVELALDPRLELVTDREAAELEVLPDREVREHRPTPHHQRHALSAADLGRQRA